MSRRLWLPVVSGPLAPYAAGYRLWMLERGYKPRSVVNRLELLGQLSRWLEVEALTPVELIPEQVERFLERRRAAGYSRCVSAQSRALPLEYLRELGVAPCPAPVEVAEGPLERLLSDYRQYLFEERGLCARTVLECYEPTARSFLSGREGPHGLAVEDLSAADVSGFLALELPTRGIDTARTVASGLRCLLRYLRMVGLIELPLEWAVPGIADLRDRSLPKGLEPAVVAKLLAGCDRRRTVGRRDYAVLLLLLRLGLRRGEVAGLGLDDIDWRGGEILVRGKGGRHDVLPLPVVIRSFLRHVVNVASVPVLVSEATRILRASSTSSLLLLAVIVPTGLRTPGLKAQRRQRRRSSGCAVCGCRSLAGCRGAWWARIGRSLSRSSVTWRG